MKAGHRRKLTKVRWLDRGLVYGTYLALCTNEAQFKAAIKQFKLPWEADTPWIKPTHNACVHTWDSDATAAPVCIVCIDGEKAKDKDPVVVATLLVHEAVHVWQVAERIIGGTQADEMEAYAIQNIAGELMNEYRNTMT